MTLKAMLGLYLEHEMEGLKAAKSFIQAGSAYANVQETKPQVCFS
jgi:hypothetical protein